MWRTLYEDPVEGYVDDNSIVIIKNLKGSNSHTGISAMDHSDLLSETIDSHLNSIIVKLSTFNTWPIMRN